MLFWYLIVCCLHVECSQNALSVTFINFRGVKGPISFDLLYSNFVTLPLDLPQRPPTKICDDLSNILLASAIYSKY